MSKLSWWKTICFLGVFCGVEAIALPAQTFTMLSFTDGGPSGLVQGTDGNLYGTAYGDGYPECEAGASCGSVFRITPSGTLTTLYRFCSQGFPCTAGASPSGSLVQAADGNFYGTTTSAGANGAGTVFKITPSGALTTLYSFCAQDYPFCTDGGGPSGALVQATNGDLYGTTQTGGANGDGTVFKITPSGKLTTLHSFAGPDGAGPNGLIQAADGNFYGTTSGGGASGDGSVF